jgi:hypothetical protein
MIRQKTLWQQPTGSEEVFNDEHLEEIFRKENEEPWNLADQAFEQWRDEKKS